MTRKLFALFAATLALVMLAGCSAEQTGPLTQKSAYGDLPSSITSQELTLDMTADSTAYPASAKELSLQIKNTGSATVQFGTPYTVEKREQGVWYEIPFKDDVAFTDIGLVLAAGEVYLDTIHLDILDRPLTSGEYRIIKRFYVNEKEIVLAAVFEMNEK